MTDRSRVKRTYSEALQRNGTPCSFCATPYDKCTEYLLAYRSACCQHCYASDTHNEERGPVETVPSPAKVLQDIKDGKLHTIYGIEQALERALQEEK